MPPLIFDAHLDLAMNLVYYDRDLTQPVAKLNAAEQGLADVPFRGRATLSLPELRRSGVAVCLATLLARSGPVHKRQPSYRRIDLDYPTRDGAFCSCMAQLAWYRLMERRGELAILTTAEQLEAHWLRWSEATDHARLPIGVILTMEGADAVHSPADLAWWREQGLRAIGPAHYGHSHYAAGTGVEGGLTPAGVELLVAMQEQGIALDVTHLADAAMAQAFATFGGTIWASHHNCRALVPADRQLTDLQIRKLVDRDAVIGTAMDAWMLHPKWVRQVTNPSELSLAAAVDHIDHVCQIAGDAKHVGLGSDLDGGYGNEQTARELRVYGDLHRLADLLSRRGFSDADVASYFHGNWLRKMGQFLSG